MKFNPLKAAYGYKLFSDDDDYFNDVDSIKQIKCTDNCFRFIAFEVKHEKEKMENAYCQIFTLEKVLTIPLAVVQLDVTDSKLISGKITDSDGKPVHFTKTAWFNLNSCKIVKFDLKPEFVGRTVRDLLDSIRKSEIPEIHGYPVKDWFDELNRSKSK